MFTHMAVRIFSWLPWARHTKNSGKFSLQTSFSIFVRPSLPLVGDNILVVPLVGEVIGSLHGFSSEKSLDTDNSLACSCNAVSV
jgi:hypothetical protein